MTLKEFQKLKVGDIVLAKVQKASNIKSRKRKAVIKYLFHSWRLPSAEISYVDTHKRSYKSFRQIHLVAKEKPRNIKKERA